MGLRQAGNRYREGELVHFRDDNIDEKQAEMITTRKTL